MRIENERTEIAMKKKAELTVLHWVLPLFVSGCVVIYGVLFYWPNRKEHAELTKLEQDAINAELLTDVVKTSLDAEQNRLHEITDELDSTRVHFLNKQNVVLIPARLHQLARESNLQITQLAPFASQALSSFSQHRFTLNLEGSPPAALDFIYQLERAYPTLRISQFSTGASQDTQINNIFLVLEIFAGSSEKSN